MTTILRERQLRRAVLVLFVLSGATGLVYEVIWIRLLSLVFGNTVYAISTVLTAFWTGLAIGAFAAGRWIDRHPEPLRIYGLLEGAVGLYCVATPALLALATPIYVSLARGWPDSSGLFLASRFALGFAVLLVPTTCMGATLPVMAKFYVRRFEKVGRGVGLLYGLNTLGAVVGCFGAGFVSFELIGVSRTLWAAGALNVLIAATAWSLSRSSAPAPAYPEPSSVESSLEESAPKAWWLLVAFAVAGFASLVYEVAWTRVLVLVIGSTVYAYTTMLTIFILGIGLGSLLIAPLLDRRKDLLLWFAAMEAAIGFWALVSLPLFNALPEAFVKGYALIGASWLGIVGMKFAFSALIMLPATLCMGGTFPIVCRLYTGGMEGLGQSVGSVYAANTAGAIAGSFLTGFVAIPLIGTKAAITMAAGLNVLLAVGLCLSSKRTSFKLRIGLVAAGGLAAFPMMVWFTPSWNRQLLSAGAFHLGRQVKGNVEEYRQTVLGRELLYFAEGPAATVTVLRAGPLMSLQVNGKAVASNHRYDMTNQLFLAHLPVMLHPEPKEVFIVGLGAGITAGSVATHAVERIDIAEIAPEVPPAARLFSELNHHVLDDPRVRLILTDGRNHLLVSESRYDVITSDPIHPWRAGANSLFTADYYRLARAHLKPGGLMCQWLPLYGLDSRSVKSVVKTFASVFPHVTLWSSQSVAASMLIGSEEPLRVDLENFARRFQRPSVRDDLALVGVRSPWTLLGGFLFDEGSVEAFSGATGLNTDDHPLLEFAAPRSFYNPGNTYPSIVMALLGHRSPLRPHLAEAPEELIRAIENNFAATGAVLEGLAKMQLGRTEEGQALFEKALEADPGHLVAREMLSAILLNRGLEATDAGQLEEAEVVLKRTVFLNPTVQAHRALGNVYYKEELWEKAAFEYRGALDKEPFSAAAHKSLGYALIGLGEREQEALHHLNLALELEPDDPEAEHLRSLIARLADSLAAPSK